MSHQFYYLFTNTFFSKDTCLGEQKNYRISLSKFSLKTENSAENFAFGMLNPITNLDVNIISKKLALCVSLRDTLKRTYHLQNIVAKNP